MKRIIWGMTLSVLTAGSVHAALLSRADGNAVYDTDRDVTWLRDANYAQTSGYDTDGRMTWNEAQSWISALNADNHLGTNEWRLPVTGQPDASCLYQVSGQGSGTGCTGSDMGHLFNVEGVGASSQGPFFQIQSSYYWSATTYAPTPSWAWMFYFLFGSQDAGDKDVGHYVWAVTTGDIDNTSAVPVPGALWLFGTGLAALGAKLKRRARGAVIAA